MRERVAKRRRARERRFKRGDLVHAAGCTEPLCCVRQAVFGGYEMVNEAMAERIRVPRSVVESVVRRAAQASPGGEGGSDA